MHENSLANEAGLQRSSQLDVRDLRRIVVVARVLQAPEETPTLNA